MDNDFFFLFWGKLFPLYSRGRGFREMASVHSEMVTRTVGPCPTVGVPSHWTEHQFPGTVSKYVFVIFCLEKWQGHLCEHLNWQWESQNLHLLGDFVGCYLEKKHRKVWFQTQHSTRKWKFHCFFLT